MRNARQVDQEAARQRDVGRQTRPFLGHCVLADLHHELLTLLQEVLDRGGR